MNAFLASVLDLKKKNIYIEFFSKMPFDMKWTAAHTHAELWVVNYLTLSVYPETPRLADSTERGGYGDWLAHTGAKSEHDVLRFKSRISENCASHN